MQRMGSKASQVPALGPTLDSFDALAAGQALILMKLLNLKSWPWGPTLESLDSLDSFDALDSEAPDGLWGGDLDLTSMGGRAFVDSLDPVYSDPAPNLMHILHRKVAPRTLDSDTTPDSGASASHASSGANASQLLALGPTLDSVDSFASGQALTLMNLPNRKSWPWARL